MPKLTSTELKVLALEAEIMFNNGVKEKRDQITNSKEYLSFEYNFTISLLGKKFQKLINDANEIKASMASNGFPVTSYRKDTVDYLCELRQQYQDHLKNKEFPLPSFDIEERINHNGHFYTSSPYDYFLHQLSLKQLTTDADLADMLSLIVKEALLKVK